MVYKGKPDSFWRKQFLKLEGMNRFSVRGVMRALGYKSPSAAQNAVYHFERLGLVVHDPRPSGEWKVNDN